MSKKKGATEAAVTKSYTVFYSGEAEKISPNNKGLLEQQQDSFPSRVFRPLFGQGSTNNAGFLAAVLRSPDICLIEANSSKLFMHRCYADWQHRMTQLAALSQD